MRHIVVKKTIGRDDPHGFCDAMALFSGLSKSRIKKAMVKGAAWIERPGQKMHRIRRATATLKPGDVVALYYDETILDAAAPQADCLKDLDHYSIWFKPAGLMSQGTRYGDHCALLRQIELAFNRKRRALPVHRLDREVAGLIIVAHNSRAAAALSKLFRKGQIDKRYQARVLGDLSQFGAHGTLSHELDSRPALTRYKQLSYDAESDQSLVDIQIITGRRHQIRRHFDMIGYPIIGDPRYGIGNKNKSGLQLTAYGLAFNCPFGNGPVNIRIDMEKMI